MLYVKSQLLAGMLYQISYLQVWCLLAPINISVILSPTTSSSYSLVSLKGTIKIEMVSQGYILNKELYINILKVVIVFKEAPIVENLCDLINIYLKVTQYIVFSLREVGYILVVFIFYSSWQIGFLIGYRYVLTHYTRAV